MRRLHGLVSGWCMFGGVVLIEVSIVGGVIKALGKRLASPLHKTLIGISFLIVGGLYGSYLVNGAATSGINGTCGGSCFCQCYFVIGWLRLITANYCW